MTPDAAARAHWPERLRALREQYRTNPSLHATKTAYINGLEYEYERAHTAGVSEERARVDAVMNDARTCPCHGCEMLRRASAAIIATLRDGPTP